MNFVAPFLFCTSYSNLRSLKRVLFNSVIHSFFFFPIEGRQHYAAKQPTTNWYGEKERKRLIIRHSVVPRIGSTSINEKKEVLSNGRNSPAFFPPFIYSVEALKTAASFRPTPPPICSMQGGVSAFPSHLKNGTSNCPLQSR